MSALRKKFRSNNKIGDLTVSFRRDGKLAHNQNERWSKWASEHAALITAAGLPSDVVAAEQKFAYFVDYNYNQDGYLGIAPWYSAYDMTHDEQVALWDLIQAAYTSLWTYPHEYSRSNLERIYGPPSWRDSDVA